jgi:hypothetical protein
VERQPLVAPDHVEHASEGHAQVVAQDAFRSRR